MNEAEQQIRPLVDAETAAWNARHANALGISLANEARRAIKWLERNAAPMSTLSTRLTKAFELRYPIVSAPMAFAGGGALAAAVSRAGGLGMIGGGYGDPAWLDEQFDAANGEQVGVGFITWSLQQSPSLLTNVLKHRPAAVMLSFGDPRPFVGAIRGAGAKLICQCQDMEHIESAVEGAGYREAFTLGDPDNTGVWFGEAAGLIHSIEPASVILERMAAEAVLHLERHGGATIV